LISHQALPTSSSLIEIYAFENVVAPARPILDVGNLEVPSSLGSSQKDIDTSDFVEPALAGRLQNYGLGHVAAFTSNAFAVPWNAFVFFCAFVSCVVVF
jgi:hypothetical protein